MRHRVFIATSLDGFIADQNGGIDWLHSIPIPEDTDTGFSAFMDETDALVMGRKTFETVVGFDVDWPYSKPVFVLSNTLKEVPSELAEKAFIVMGTPAEVSQKLKSLGHTNLYIDGGSTIQSFLEADMIDEMIITVMPIALGAGVSLFGELSSPKQFECKETKLFANKIAQQRYVRIR